MASEKAKVQRLLEHAQELEAIVEAPFDLTGAGHLIPDVITRPDKEGGAPDIPVRTAARTKRVTAWTARAQHRS